MRASADIEIELVHYFRICAAVVVMVLEDKSAIKEEDWPSAPKSNTWMLPLEDLAYSVFLPSSISICTIGSTINNELV